MVCSFFLATERSYWSDKMEGLWRGRPVVSSTLGPCCLFLETKAQSDILKGNLLAKAGAAISNVLDTGGQFKIPKERLPKSEKKSGLRGIQTKNCRTAVQAFVIISGLFTQQIVPGNLETEVQKKKKDGFEDQNCVTSLPWTSQHRILTNMVKRSYSCLHNSKTKSNPSWQPIL